MKSADRSPVPTPGADDAWSDWVQRFFRVNSRTFSLATRLLPRNVREPVAVVYWYCRTIDNIADDGVGGTQARDRLEGAAEALDRCLGGNPDPEPLWRHLAAVHAEWTLSRSALFELVDGARWDLEHRPVETLDDLLAYSELVAGSVGEMMLPFLVAPDADRTPLIAPARSLGVAMQITNVLRDVGEDLGTLGRVYLPGDLVRKAGIAPGSAPDPKDSAYRALVELLMAEAEHRYRIGMSGVSGLAPATRMGILAAARLYREILNEIRGNGYDNVTRRAVVPFRRKVIRIVYDGYVRRRTRLGDAP